MIPVIGRRMQEIKERNAKLINFTWFTPISEKVLQSCEFYLATLRHKKTDRVTDLVPNRMGTNNY